MTIVLSMSSSTPLSIMKWVLPEVRLMEGSDVQPLKALSPMTSMLEPLMVTLVRAEQPLNNPLGMVFEELITSGREHA